MFRTGGSLSCGDERLVKPLRRVCELVVLRWDEILELVLKLRECVPLEPADPLARDAELAADRLERLDLAVEAEAELDDPPFPVRQPAHGAPHRQASHRIERG